eukprot:jgi/Hompol1/6406/HPOL_000949-RA
MPQIQTNEELSLSRICTGDQDIIDIVRDAGQYDQLELQELQFQELRQNCKSKGICYVQMRTPDAAVAVKLAFDRIRPPK